MSSPRNYLPQEVNNLAIEFAYDGSAFSGYARQHDQVTVQGDLEAALRAVLGDSFRTFVSGRTDRGVHANSQFVSVVLEDPKYIDLDKFRRSIERLTSASIAIRAVWSMPEDFHARFSAVARRYRYCLLTGDFALPMERRAGWHIGSPLDRDALFAAASYLVGEKNFATFCRADPNGGSLNRRVSEVSVFETDRDHIHIEIEANAFCHQMVRALVGYLVKVALGNATPWDFSRALDAQDRSKGVDLAPPYGLFLIMVRFEERFEFLNRPVISVGNRVMSKRLED
ncbi:tRNA pseudouridine(38-40) synthase TruA [Acidithrix ferrooxidans]|uniref:tRNA pseudouridine synthase A n=1 Tax=Acidithrix ferrooxidans TaxID=1280514 RepID=A0A0D8HL31_9ACTN|nr:tRNA pseudouridine(38-40) synthase TruA [Acidithrix ferrooxidans]KJF18559.1 tRNA pseudouridine synthase A [Acidithrix ferrooxidans]